MTKDLLINLFRTPWFVLILYSLVSGIAASLGRSGFGVCMLCPLNIQVWLSGFSLELLEYLKTLILKNFILLILCFPFFTYHNIASLSYWHQTNE